MKHPQHILAFDKRTFWGAAPALSGFADMAPKSFWEMAMRSLFIGRRHELETDERFAQVLPYVVLWRNAAVLGTGRGKDVFVYQRGKGVGESRLVGNVSVGLGGHVDLSDVVSDSNSVIDLLATMAGALARELNEELSFLSPTAMEVTFDDMRMHHVLSPMFCGFINDESNAVGRVHGGVVFSLEIPVGYEPVCREQELDTIGWRDPLSVVGDVENWSSLVLENIDKVWS